VDWKIVQSQFKDLVPLTYRKDLGDSDRAMERPSEEDDAATVEAALEKITNGKIKAAQPKHVPDSQGKTAFIRYTPGQQGGSDGSKQRIIKMSEVVEGPLEPPRFKHKKVPWSSQSITPRLNPPVKPSVTNTGWRCIAVSTKPKTIAP